MQKSFVMSKTVFEEKGVEILRNRGMSKSEFARQIRFRFSADATQIARVCGISYAEAANLLDSV